MVLYQTPNFSGFQFGVGYSWNANGDIESSGYYTDATGRHHYGQNDANNQEVTTGLRYTNGPIDVALTYDLLKVGSLNAPVKANGDQDSVSVQEWTLGGSYDFEVVKAYLAFGQTRNGLFGNGYYDLGGVDDLPAVMNGFRANNYLVGLSAPIGNGNLMFSWQMSDPNKSSDDVKDGLGVDHKMNIFGLGYTYNLSKRTNLYAWGSYTKHAQYQDDLKTTDVGVGIRHQF
jgi:predicted porin